MLNISFLKKQKVRIFLALLFGSVGTLSFSPFNYWLMAIVSLVGLLSVTLNCTIKQSFFLGLYWGCGLFSTGIGWIYKSIASFGGMPFFINISLVFLLVMYLSLYTGLFSGLLAYFWPSTSYYRLVIAAPVLWQITEFLRASILTGFPWLQFGYTQIDGPLQGIAPLLGVDFITFMLIIISGLIVYSINKRHKVSAIIAISFLFFPWPLSKYYWFTSLPEKAISIAIVQGNIPQKIKWVPNKLGLILQTYLNATIPYIGHVDVIVWPESAIPNDEANQNSFLTMLDKKLRKKNTRLITGILNIQTASKNKKMYNSAIMLGNSEKYSYPAKYRYDKHHLVPFGEFMPLEHILHPIAPFFNVPIFNFTKGNAIQPLIKVYGCNLTIVICYEVIFSQQVRHNFHKNTDFILTISNDAWFDHSIGPWQHLQMARMRALELGRPLLRSTNNGITVIINANGKIVSKIPQFTLRVLHVLVTPTTGITPYARFGVIPLWSLVALLIMFLLIFSI
ncbi:Apolipoprotein N-acyltransferase [Candidatus Ecksteinia adelgidicola]|nr:Apolipoprotein N-acyltransferase [Candidatus Ecksteinia adelgidicola]